MTRQDPTPEPPAEPRPGRDLNGQHPLPRQSDWDRPGERLEELYRRAAVQAAETAAWYRRAARAPRRAAKALRAAGLVLATAGAALPVLQLAGAVPGAAAWGYGALVLAAGCAAADRRLGLTSAWMRSTATAQALRRRLDALHHEWTAERLRDALGPADTHPGEGPERCLAVLRRFADDTDELVREETAAWMREFCGPMAGMPAMRAAGRAAPPAAARPAPPPPGTARPNMPRQRPPE